MFDPLNLDEIEIPDDRFEFVFDGTTYTCSSRMTPWASTCLAAGDSMAVLAELIGAEQWAQIQRSSKPFDVEHARALGRRIDAEIKARGVRNGS